MRYDVMMDYDEALMCNVDVAMICVAADSPSLEKSNRDEFWRWT